MKNRSFVWATFVILATFASPVRAGEPRWIGSLGGTFGSSDPPRQSGFSAALAALWTLPPIALGPSLFVDDLGSQIGQLYDPNDGTPLGPVQEYDRLAYGGAWRVDVPFPIGRTRSGYVGGAWGIYRVQDAQFGTALDAFSAIGLNLAAGVRSVWGRTGVGLSVKYNRLFDDRQDHYASASVDLLWPGAFRAAESGMAKAPKGGN